MKDITITFAEGPPDTLKGVVEASDGYHTFDELYEHRIALYLTLLQLSVGLDIWRSLVHHDGSSFEGWFILGINKAAGKQISYHLPLRAWDDCSFAETLDRAPEWDGHTSDDVLTRLRGLWVSTVGRGVCGNSRTRRDKALRGL